MQWRDEAIILGTRRHGETSAIVEAMTRRHGRHLGLVRGGRSRRLRPVLQAGNRVEVTWRARLDEHLGTFAVEPLRLDAARLMASAAAVHGLQAVAAHLRLLPERDPHESLFETMGLIVDHLEDPAAAAELFCRFELLVLEELGFGLDLDRCAATGLAQDLAYVSPKSGRAVSRDAGRPWHDQLLALPAFLLPGSGLRGTPDALADAFRLTGFFLARDLWEPRSMPEPASRASFIAALSRPGKVSDGEDAA